MKEISTASVVRVVVGCLMCLGLVYIFPWKSMTWGKVKVAPGDVVTVVGEAKTKMQNQKASFSAGVNAVSDDKDVAIADVNKKVDSIIQSVSAFGVAATDIKTQNLNVYQSEETYYEEGRQKSRLGQWRVSNSIEIVLTDVNKASELADLLTKSGANNVYGPNFTVDDTTGSETGLIEEAMKNAREKAQNVAAVAGRSLGNMVSFTEGYQTQPALYRMESGGGGGGMEPGSATVTKTVTVTYELIK